jgi:hypothetical protein
MNLYTRRFENFRTISSGKKKTPDISPRQPAGKGRKKKQKNPGINPGQPAGKGRKKKKKKEVLSVCPSRS